MWKLSLPSNISNCLILQVFANSKNFQALIKSIDNIPGDCQGLKKWGCENVKTLFIELLFLISHCALRSSIGPLVDSQQLRTKSQNWIRYYQAVMPHTSYSSYVYLNKLYQYHSTYWLNEQIRNHKRYWGGNNIFGKSNSSSSLRDYSEPRQSILFDQHPTAPPTKHYTLTTLRERDSVSMCSLAYKY